MSTHSPSNRAALRAFVVVALCVIMFGAVAMDFRRLSHPLGTFGFATNGDSVVIAVDGNSPAAKAGIQVGDSIDLSATPPQFRLDPGQFVRNPGQSDIFEVVHKGIRRSSTLTAVVQPSANSILYIVFHIVEFAVGVLFMFIGAALVLLRPSLMTWGFFFYSLANSGNTTVALASLPFPVSWWGVIFLILISVAGAVGLLIFALLFLSEPLSGWRLAARRLIPWLFTALVLFSIYQAYQQGWIGGPPGEMLSRIGFLINALLSLLVLFAFIDTYLRARGSDRQRIRWVIVGFGTWLIASYGNQVLLVYSPYSPWWVFHTLALSGILVPLTFAYAVLKHRVIDVNFVVSRAIVYGVITTLLVGALSIIDWLLIEKLKLVRLGTVAEVGAAVAVGFWFNGLHKRIDTFIDATFFRQRHQAERQLARNASALPFSTTVEAVAHALIAEPVRALSLGSAALFKLGQDGSYIRETSEGWSETDISKLDREDDHLMTLLLAENGPVSLYDHPWRIQGTPSGPSHPVLALPIIVRRELTAIVFYGAHIHGEALDPDEIKAIAGLAPGAAAAYDHLEAEAMKRKLDSMASENESLRTQLAEAQIQPA